LVIFAAKSRKLPKQPPHFVHTQSPLRGEQAFLKARNRLQIPIISGGFRGILLLSLLLLVSVHLHAQQDDSTWAVPKGQTRAGTYEQLQADPNHFEHIDTAMHHVQQFDPGYMHNLGEPGTPTFPLLFSSYRAPGFQLGFNQWDLYRLQPGQMKFYNTQNPYSDFYYAQGGQIMQTFNAMHSQNIGPNSNFSIQYRHLATTKSYYENQNTQLNGVIANGWYRSPNRRYTIMGGAIFNTFNERENGGIQNDTFFKELPASDRTGLPVKYNTGRQNWLDQDYTFKQYLMAGPTERRKIHDTDSVAVKILHPKFFIAHKFDLGHISYAYHDVSNPNTLFRQNIYDPLSSEDQYSSFQVSNAISIGQTAFSEEPAKKDSTKYRQHKLYYEAYIKYSYYKVRQDGGPGAGYYDFDNESIGLDASRNGKFGFVAHGEYYLHGYNQNDYLATARVFTPFLPGTSFKTFTVEGKQQQYTQAYTDEYLLMNHFLWVRSLNPSQVHELSAFFSDSAGFKLGGTYSIVSNLVYYDTSARPTQSGQDLHYIKLFVTKNFVFGPIHLNHDITYQHRISGEDVVRVPDWVIRTSYYFEHYLFRKALLLQLGFDFYYNSAYYSYSYMPEISRFYLQNNEKVGNYQVYDLWLAGKVQRFMVFFKLEHANQGLSGSNYLLLPGYPMMPRTFRLGLRWTFYN
jgi:hypothetical protein